MWGVIVDYRAERPLGASSDPLGRMVRRPGRRKQMRTASKKVPDRESVVSSASRRRVRVLSPRSTLQKGPRYRRDTPL